MARTRKRFYTTDQFGATEIILAWPYLLDARYFCAAGPGRAVLSSRHPAVRQAIRNNLVIDVLFGSEEMKQARQAHPTTVAARFPVETK